jgi:two-component system sensor histidine kinase PhoQ
MAAARAPSLVARLVVALAAVSVLLSGVAALALDVLYRGLALDARKEVLDAQVIALIATAELQRGAGLVPATLAEARLATPGTGLYAEIRNARGESTWRSPSSVGSGLTLRASPAAGQRIYEERRLPDGTRLLALSLGVSWETGSVAPETYVISAAESLEPYYAQVARVRAWLAAGAVLLMFLLVVGLSGALRAGLKPLARLEKQILDVESGRRELLGGDWPRELAGVTQNLNALLAGDRARLARYRTTLGNLAHSLKTPIAALGSMLATGGLTPRAVKPELDRMQSIVDHQLRRAVLAGAGSSVASLTVAGPLNELAGALAKVYRDKAVNCSLELPAELAYPIETGDLMELTGNLLDNAFKYGRSRVRLRAGAWERPEWRRPGIWLEVEDDGPGIPAGDRLRVLERGVRADESVAGQGIGLAAAHEVASAYAGSMVIGDSLLGGAAVRVQLPGR